MQAVNIVPCYFSEQGVGQIIGLHFRRLDAVRVIDGTDDFNFFGFLLARKNQRTGRGTDLTFALTAEWIAYYG